MIGGLRRKTPQARVALATRAAVWPSCLSQRVFT